MKSWHSSYIYISPSQWTTYLMFESNTYNFLLLPVTLTIWWLNVPVVVLYSRYKIFCLTQTDMENPNSQGGRAETHAIFSFLTFHSILCEELIPPATQISVITPCAVELRHTRHFYSFSGNLLGSPRSCICNVHRLFPSYSEIMDTQSHISYWFVNVK